MEIESQSSNPSRQSQDDIQEKDLNFYYVEQIMGEWPYKGEIFYKVKWQGYPYDDCTWQPQKQILLMPEGQKYIDDYKRKIKGSDQKDQFSKMNKQHKVRAIRSYKMCEKQKYYLIKWSNTDEQQNTWEQATVIKKNYPQLVQIFEDYVKEKRVNISFGELVYDLENIGNFIMDVPYQIIDIKKKKQQIYYLVLWDFRETGMNPQETWVTAQQFLQYDKKEFLFNFYEQHLLQKENFNCSENLDDKMFFLNSEQREAKIKEMLEKEEQSQNKQQNCD